MNGEGLVRARKMDSKSKVMVDRVGWTAVFIGIGTRVLCSSGAAGICAGCGTCYIVLIYEILLQVLPLGLA